MDIEKLLKKERLEVAAEEAEIQAVIQKAKMAFLESESKQLLSCHEFIWNQLRMIRKRWWAIQFVVLYFAWLFLSTENEVLYLRRGMGVFAALFAIILIPEGISSCSASTAGSWMCHSRILTIPTAL